MGRGNQRFVKKVKLPVLVLEVPLQMMEALEVRGLGRLNTQVVAADREGRVVTSLDASDALMKVHGSF